MSCLEMRSDQVVQPKDEQAEEKRELKRTPRFLAR